MELEINTIKDGNRQIQICLRSGNNTIISLQTEACLSQAEKLLPLIDSAMRSKQIKSRQLKRIKVVNEGGTFTSLRIGIVTANALGYALGIPVLPSSLINSKNRFSLLGKTLVAPKYSSKPNITKPKN